MDGAASALRLFGAAKFFLSFAYQKVHILIIEFKNDASCLNGYNIFLNVYSLDMNNGNKNINNGMVPLLIHKVPVSFIGVEIAYRIPSLYFYKCSYAHSCFHLSGTAKQSLLMKYSLCSYYKE